MNRYLDKPLLYTILLLMALGGLLLFSASEQNATVMLRQILRACCGLGILYCCASIPAHVYRRWAPWFFTFSVLLLLMVLVAGVISKGAQRWLSILHFHFEPSEIMKLAMPMMLASYLHDRPLPPTRSTLCFCLLLLVIPTFLIIKQPDLGTGLMVGFIGFSVLLLAGLHRYFILSGILLISIASPIFWYFMHDYQRNRILIFLNPERAPLGAGYHIIQSKIALGSGGFFGKGWLNGTQAHLQFLPEHATDFIFALCGEEFGFLGCSILLALPLFIVLRGLYISSKATDTFSRLLAGSLALSFFAAVFVNVGMVMGLLPVVGLPFPLVSYGGTSMMITMAELGVLMSLVPRDLFRSKNKRYLMHLKISEK